MELLKKRTNIKKRICLVGNMHGFFQYLLLSSEEEICQTYFFWNYVGFPEELRMKFEGMGSMIPKPHFVRQTKIPLLNTLITVFRTFFDYYVYYPLKWPFLLKTNLEYWGHDHIYNSFCFLRKHPFSLLEDGLLNYLPYSLSYEKETLNNKFLLKISTFLFGDLFLHFLEFAGSEKSCIKIHLTGLTEIDKSIKHCINKTEINSFFSLWQMSSDRKRDFVNRVMGLSDEMINLCRKCNRILLTEPFSEDEIISEKEKLNVYREIINKIGSEGLLIKPHPREMTDYTIVFPNIPVLKTYAPIQLLSLNNVKFDIAYSIYSTALYDFPYKIKICIIGPEIHPLLIKRFANRTISDIGLIKDNVEIIEYENLS